MAELEKVIRGLECLSNPYVQDMDERDCENCQYDNACCFLDVTADAISLLKAREPRVMTLEEVKGMKRLTICSVEQRSKVIKNAFNAEYGGIVTLGNENFLDFGLYGDTNRYRRTEAGYGKTWRCWTSRPSDSERENTPWEK